MKKKILTRFTHLLSLSLLLLFADSRVFSQSATFAYEGRLTQAGTPVTGAFDMQFKLFDTAGAGTGARQGGTITNSAVPVTNGLFTVTLDFGAAVFDGSPRFLEISVRAGGASPYDILTPRQQVASIPYAIQSLNAAQLNGRPATNFVQANTNGNVGIGTNNTAPGVRLEVNGVARVAPGGSGGYLQIGAPNGETGLGVIGTNRFDLRFDGMTLKLVAGPGTGPPPPDYGISINTNGHVGIGTANLFPGYQLNVKGTTLLEPGGTGGGFVGFGTPNGETGMTISGNGNGNNRADVRFDGSTLKLVATAAAGPPLAENGVVISTSGNVGIGVPPTSLDPNIKLEVKSANGFAVFGRSGFEGVHGESTSATAAAVAGFNLSTGPGVYGESRGSGTGVRGNATGSGVGVYGQSASGPAVHAEGNATQPRDRGGFAKAMLYVNAEGVILRCYNGVTGSSIGDCGGFRVNSPGPGIHQITFPFPVRDRFVSVTAEYRGGNNGTGTSAHRGANFGFEASFPDTVITVWTFADGDEDNNHFGRFMIIVF